MTREKIRRKYRQLCVHSQNLEKGIKATRGTVKAVIDKFLDICLEIKRLQSQCPHPEIISQPVFPTPDCRQEICADCGKVFKECECMLCGAERELNDPSPGQ